MSYEGQSPRVVLSSAAQAARALRLVSKAARIMIYVSVAFTIFVTPITYLEPPLWRTLGMLDILIGIPVGIGLTALSRFFLFGFVWFFAEYFARVLDNVAQAGKPGNAA